MDCFDSMSWVGSSTVIQQSAFKCNSNLENVRHCFWYWFCNFRIEACAALSSCHFWFNPSYKTSSKLHLESEKKKHTVVRSPITAGYIHLWFSAQGELKFQASCSVRCSLFELFDSCSRQIITSGAAGLWILGWSKKNRSMSVGSSSRLISPSVLRISWRHDMRICQGVWGSVR